MLKDRKMLSAFIGNNSEYYLSRFEKFYVSGGRFAVNWNWAGFFIPQIWLFYRRMYLYGFVLLFLTCFLNVIGWLLSGIIVGICGNWLYYKHAQDKLRLLCIEKKIGSAFSNDIQSAAQMSGGTDLVLAMVIAFLTLFIYVSVFVSAGILAGILLL